MDGGPLEQALRDLADGEDIKAGMLIHGTRLAMTGRMVSPGLFEMLVLLGRETVLSTTRSTRSQTLMKRRDFIKRLA